MARRAAAGSGSMRGRGRTPDPLLVARAARAGGRGASADRPACNGRSGSGRGPREAGPSRARFGLEELGYPVASPFAIEIGKPHTLAQGPRNRQGQILLDARMSLLFIVFWRCARVAGRVPDGGRVRSVFLRCVEGFGAASGGLGRVAGEPVGWRGGVRTRRRLWGGRTLSVWLVRGALARRRGGVARSAGGLGGDNRSAL